jgi:hypothetical protein
MKIKWKVFVTFFVLLAFTAACGPGEGNNTSNDGDSIAMSVTQTIAALGGGEDSPLDDVPPAERGEKDTGLTPSEVGGPTPLRVAYLSDGALWMWTEGGSITELYRGDKVTDIALSHDGWVVAFTTQGAEENQTRLWAVNADGTHIQTMLVADEINAFASYEDGQGATIYQMEFIPGSYNLAFNTRNIIFHGFAPVDDLHVLDMTTAGLTTLFEAGEGGWFAISPDGGQFAFTGPADRTGTLSFVNTDGTNLRRDILIYPYVNTASEYWFYPKPVWWPDNLGISMVLPSPEPFQPGATMSVWSVPADGSTPTEYGPFTTDMALFGSEEWISPDATKVAYLQRVGEPTDNKWDLHVAALDGSGDMILYNGQFSFTGWSPDGNYFVIEQGTNLFVGQVGLYGVAPLTEMPTAGYMTWIDSERFIFYSGYSPDYDLRMGRLSGPGFSIAQLNVEYPVYAVAVP